LTTRNSVLYCGMKKLKIGQRVKVDGPSNQYPFERIVDEGVIIKNSPVYLVQLKALRETLTFRRRDLTIQTDVV